MADINRAMTASCGVPHSGRVAEVVLVTFARGEGALRCDVLQVFSKTGELLAEHDAIHPDPVYASYFLRERVKPEWLKVWAESGAADIDAQALEVAHG